MGWQEGIKNKPICWTVVGFIKGVSITGAGLFLATAFLKCAAIIRSSGCWCVYSQSHSGQSDPPGEVLFALLVEDHLVLLGQSALRTAGLTQGQEAQCSCPAFLFLVLVRRNWQILPTTPKCGHAGISFHSPSIWKGSGVSQDKEKAFFPITHPHFPLAGCWVLKPEPCFSSTIQSGLGCEHLNILLMLCRCFQSSVCVILQAGGAVVIMSRFSGGCRANENFLPLGFHAPLQALHPRSQGWGKLMEELQC